jgi:hypothetical protein
MGRNQEHSSLYRELSSLKEQINYWQYQLYLVKDQCWDIWCSIDEYTFIKNKAYEIKDIRSIIKDYELQISEIKQKIKQVNRDINLKGGNK